MKFKLDKYTSESAKINKQEYLELYNQSIEKPDQIVFSNALLKIRSGKIMRRILGQVAKKELHSLGDNSTFAEPEVVNSIIKALYNK